MSGAICCGAGRSFKRHIAIRYAFTGKNAGNAAPVVVFDYVETAGRKRMEMRLPGEYTRDLATFTANFHGNPLVANQPQGMGTLASIAMASRYENFRPSTQSALHSARNATAKSSHRIGLMQQDRLD